MKKRWVYLGQSYAKMKKIEKEICDITDRIDISRLLNDVAMEIKGEYCNFVDEIGKGQCVEWWFDAFSSRSNYLSRNFREICYLEILKRLEHVDIVFVESLGMRRAIEKTEFRGDIVCGQVSWGSIMFYFRWGLESWRMIKSWIKAKMSKSHYVGNVDVIVSTFVHEGDIDRDRYFLFLHGWLKGKGLRVAVHPMLVGSHDYKKLRNSRMNYIIAEDYLRFKDYLTIFGFPFRLLKKKIKVPLFRGMDISDIVDDDRRTQVVNVGMRALKEYLLFLRLKDVIQHNRLILWHENQMINKAVIMGARKSFVDSKIIGAQCIIHAPLMFEMMHTKGEIDACIVPDKVLETGESQVKLAQTFVKFNCESAPALKYGHLFGDFEYNPNTLLVLLPFDVGESIELLDLIRNLNWKILIKAHPDCDIKKLGKIPENFSFYKGSMIDCLKVAKCVISSNSSSAVEAVAMGIPVVVVMRVNDLNFDRLYGIESEMISRCWGSDEIVDAVNRYCRVNGYKFKAEGERIRCMFFEPISDKGMEKFL